MAASDFITSAKVKGREGDVGVNRPNSEAVNQKMMGSINGLIDSSFFTIDIDHKGFYSSSYLFEGAPIRIEKASEIIWYQMGILFTGASGTNTFNFKIYDNTGAFVNNLFGGGASRCLISGNSGNVVLVGRNIDEAITFSTGTAGHSFQYGDLNLTTLQAGYVLVPFIENGALNARSINFSMKLREQ
tara:strand:- start:2005 stop:2565 length:561 start_codon:yes stop_codon:yes gene_type:complete